MPTAEDFKIGSTVGGKYRIEECLGQGGMGSVYRVTHLYLNKEFAMKAVNSCVTTDVAMQRFQQEAKTATLLNHPSLVQVHDFGVFDDATPYLVMDFIDGITFAEFLKQNGPISVDDVPVLFSQVCFALLSAHESGIVHRDIKPGNIMLCTKVARDAEGSVKIVDFGIAKLLFREAGEIQALTKTGEIFGSPLYMSPEQCIGDLVDHRSDQYSLGCVLFEMLTGTPPHVGPTALNTMMLHDTMKAPTLKEASLGKEFPPALERVVGKMLARSPADRYENIGEAALSLTKACAGDSSPGSSSRSGKSTLSRQSETVTLSTKQLTMIVASTAILGVALGALGMEFLHLRTATQPVPTASVTDSTLPQSGNSAAQPENLAAQPGNSAQPSESNDASFNPLDFSDPKTTHTETLKSLKNAGAVTSTISGTGASRRRTIIFPKFALGTVLEYRKTMPSRILSKAGGIRDFDASVPLTLDVGEIADAFIAMPSIVTKIPPDLFKGLFIRLPKSESGDEDEKSQSDLAATIRELRHWTNLESIGLHYFALNKGVFENLFLLDKLRCLELTHCRFDARKFADQKIWNKLAELGFNYCGNVDPLLARLSSSSNLQILNLIGSDYSAAALGSLRKCKQLVSLNLSSDKVDDEMIEAIKSINSVRILWLDGTKYKTEHIKKLLSFPGIDKIILLKERSPSGHDVFKDPRVIYKEY
ncbi:MAG: serine/threonine protein kinase [Cyanobacteria bacterium SZAS-4]|nr:serine/threonine protein kinase [Cyanobacteria bacterium SZAS-4]